MRIHRAKIQPLMHQLREVPSILVLLVLALFTLVSAESILGEWNPNWNYTQGGADWDFPNCNNKKQQQSPVDMQSGINWWIPNNGLPFTFIPSYKSAISTKLGAENFTYTAWGDFGSIIITEPSDYLATQAIRWVAKNVKFHYPSEHTI